MPSLFMMRMLVLEEKLLSCQITRKCDGRNAETGEGALEAIPPREGAGVSPCFTERCSV